MKKLMIAATVALAGLAVNAAAVSWEATSFTALPAGSGCTKTTLGKGDVSMFVWEFAAEDWNTAYESAGGIWAAVQSGGLKLDEAYNKAGSATAQPKVSGSSSWTEGDSVYSAILFLHSDDKKYTVADATYYMENHAIGTASNAGGKSTNLGNIIGGGSSGAATAWTAVPEPTSGLLLLLGVAGLALRRRRA